MAETIETMKVRFSCTQCGKALQVAAEKAGRKVRCPGCQTVLMVPGTSQEVTAPPVEALSASSPRQPAIVEAPPPVLQESPILPPEPARESEVGAVPPVTVQSSAPAAEPPAPVPSSETLSPSAAEDPREPEAHPEAPLGQEAVQAPAEAPAEARPRPGASAARLRRGEGAGPRPRFAPRETKKTAPSRLPLLVGGIVVALAIAGWVGLTISSNMARAKLNQEIQKQVKEAEASLSGGDLDGALSGAKAARAQMLAHKGDLDPALEPAWAKGLQKIDDYKAQMDEVDALVKMADLQPAKTKEALQRKKALWDTGSAESRPLLARLDAALVEVAKIEHEKLLAALRRELAEADAYYAKGEIEQAAGLAGQLRTKVAGNEQLKDPAVQERLEKLAALAKQHAEIQALRAQAAGNFDAALKKLDDAAAKLDAGNPDHKPLLAQVAASRRQVQDDERRAKEEAKRAKNLSPQDLSTLSTLAIRLSRMDPGVRAEGSTDPAGVAMSYAGHPLRLSLDREKEAAHVVLESDSYRYRVHELLMTTRPGVCMRLVQELGRSMKEAGIAAGGAWEMIPSAPFAAARRTVEEKTEVFFGGKVYQGGAVVPANNDRAGREEFENASKELAKALQEDAAIPEDVRNTIATVVHGAYKELDTNDHLPGDFCRSVLSDGYIEKNVPAAAERLKTQFERYRKAYAAFATPAPRFMGRSAEEDELVEKVSLENHAVFRSYERKADVTHFGIKNPCDERPLLFVVYDFQGKHETFPVDAKPKTVRMTHPALGTLAEYDPASGKFSADDATWAQGAALTTYAGIPALFGRPAWSFPPHVALVDEMGNLLGLVTRAGRVDVPDFSTIAEAPKRRAAQEKYLDELARVLNSTGLLHLYFLYFHQYTLDSPITTCRGLLGSRAHCGDLHQNVYESLERRLGGRFLGDCDDLAEFYQVLTRRQGKLSFVMSVPGHATCGWIEKENNTYRMQFLDTGPPRLLERPTLDKAVEDGSRTYDRENNMHFDPKSLSYLFRFAGEPTRTPYWLSTRMFVDKDYAETMERVQGYWHFHYYALGIQTMEDMIAKGDKVPENCTELSGLYGRVEEAEKSVHWTQEALKQLGDKDILSRVNETARVSSMYHESADDQKAYEALKPEIAALKRLAQTKDMQEYIRYINSRMTIAGLLNTLDRPWEAWDLLKPDALFFVERKKMRLEHAAPITSYYAKMQAQIREEGKKPTAQEAEALKEIENLLKWFYSSWLFEDDDDFNDIQRKYAFLGVFYGAKYGKDRLLAELLKAGPYPEKERNHRNRGGNEDEDWPWIRLSLMSYAFRIGDALELDKPPEKWRKEEAVKLAVAMNGAAEHAKKFGSLSSSRFSLLTTLLLHAFLTKDWDEVEAVFKEVKQENFARFTAEVAETFGQCARFVTPEEFAKQFKLFTKYVDTRAPYFNAVYEAYRAECYEHARAAAKEALARWPADQDMKREAEYLDKLIQNRLAEKKAKAAAPKK